MITISKILSVLPPYQAKQLMVKKNQSVNDIIDGILATHNKYANHYDKICSYFIGADLMETCENIYDFLKYNTYYKVESEKTQHLKSPAAILETNYNDCKSYSLFIAGVLSGIERVTGERINYVFRFAGYKESQQEPEHVFVVVNPGKQNSIWIDPVLDQYNCHKQPAFYYDYKPTNMNNKKIGVVPIMAIEAGAKALPVILELFTHPSAPNPQDWRGWSPGDVKQWTKNDGDSVENEAVNIISYIKANGLQDITDSDAFGRMRVTIPDIANKLRRAGFGSEASAILLTGGIPGQNLPGIYQQTPARPGAGSWLSNIFNPGTGNMVNQGNNPPPQQAGQNMFFTIAIIGAGAIIAYQTLKNKRR